MPKMSALDRSNIRQMLVNVPFFHNELGMRAGLVSFSCRCIQNAKTGIRIMLRMSNTMFAGRFTLPISADNILKLSSEWFERVCKK
jgi:hypothetical protein